MNKEAKTMKEWLRTRAEKVLSQIETETDPQKLEALSYQLEGMATRAKERFCRIHREMEEPK